MIDPKRRGALREQGSAAWKTVATLFALGLVGLAGAWGLQRENTARKDKEQAERVAFLEAEIERLRGTIAATEEKRKGADEGMWRKKIEKSTTEVRGLEFLEPVQYHQLKRSDLPQVIKEKITDVYTQEQIKAMEYGYWVIGLLPEGIDLGVLYQDLLGEQIAAFYDQHKDQLFTFEGTSLENMANRIILTHELTHALQDQHFKLEKFPLESTENDDFTMALSALIEGDATLEMGQYVLNDPDKSFTWDLVGTLFGTQTEQLEKAPPYMREALLFPYLKGQEFCMTLWMRGGFEDINAAYSRPPLSTSQILHPERYLKETAWRPKFAELKPKPFRGAAARLSNVLGEFGLRMVLKERGIENAEIIAAGWDGDRYGVYEIDGKPLLAWRTAWRSPADANRFAGIANQLRTNWGTQSKGKTKLEGRTVRVTQPSETEVLVLDVPDQRMLEEATTLLKP